MKVGILYICIGNYDVFWSDFYVSCEKYFLSGHEKTYFVFTDNKGLIYSDKSNVTLIEASDLGWPYNTLLRYKMFYDIKDSLQNMNYLFFFNANALFITGINDSILPTREDNYLVSALHPGFVNKKKSKYPYERRKVSKAYIGKNEGHYYFQGCFFGGEKNEFLKLVKVCMQNVDIDLEKKIIAIWHDESHLNKYFVQVTPKILDSSFIFPENYSLRECSAKILMRDKWRFGGHNFLRKTKKEGKLMSLIKNMKSFLLNNRFVISFL